MSDTDNIKIHPTTAKIAKQRKSALWNVIYATVIIAFLLLIVLAASGR
ncbi:MAG TPA: hypothetical protein VF411_14100 [Bacteroidia bacterium]